VGIHTSADVFGHFSFEELRDADREFDHFQPSLDFALRVRQDFAVLPRNNGGEHVDALFAKTQEPVENTGAAQRRRLGPGRESALRSQQQQRRFRLGSRAR
jgi:hypothetical protein